MKLFLILKWLQNALCCDALGAYSLPSPLTGLGRVRKIGIVKG